MQTKEITLISKEVKGIYLSYVSGNYMVFAPNKAPSSFNNMNFKDPQELYDNLLITDHYNDLDNDNKLLIGAINNKLNNIGDKEARAILTDLMEDLFHLFFNTNIDDLTTIMSERLQGISNKEIKERFQKQINEFEESKYADLKENVKEKLQSRKSGDVELGRRILSDFLTSKYGAILRKNIGDVYILDGEGYLPITHDDLIIMLKNDFGDNFINDNDLKGAISYISDRREPKANIVKFRNVLYDMDNLEIVENPKDPIFTLLQIDYDLNPNAQSTLFKNFLNTTFARETEAETKEAVKGVFQISGYLLTSGNKYNILPIFTGLTGGGKSTFFNIITHIIGKDKISGVSLQNLENDSHASAEFVKSHLNIIRDSDTTMIENNSLLKNWTGNEAFRVNPKYKNSFDLSAEEVPKPILVCNTMPVFKVYEDALISRFLIVEFKVSFRHKDTQIADLDKLIISDKQEIEWFIYNSIKAYGEMVENGENFIFKINDNETMELINKHTHPLNHIIHKLILKHDPEAYDSDKFLYSVKHRPILTNDLVDVILKYSEKSAIDVPTDKHGRINKKHLLNVIKEEYDLYDGEMVLDKQTNQYSKHRDYKPKAERWTDQKGGSHNDKCYPNLIATNEYWEIIEELEKHQKPNKE